MSFSAVRTPCHRTTAESLRVEQHHAACRIAAIREFLQLLQILNSTNAKQRPSGAVKTECGSAFGADPPYGIGCAPKKGRIRSQIGVTPIYRILRLRASLW